MAHDTLFDAEENAALMAICTRRLIRNIGIGGILWGVINTGLGILFVQDSLINLGLVALGVLMLGVGVQALRRPTLGVLLAETILAALLLMWNVSISALNVLVGEPLDPRGLIFPLIIAIVFGNHYRKLSHLRGKIEAVTPERLDEATRVCKWILKKKVKQEPLLVETTDKRSRAELMSKGAFFVQRDLMRAFVAAPEAVRDAITSPHSRKWKLVFNHPVGTLTYRFSAAGTEKLRTWLAREQTPAAA